ncbi:hypothetical protein ABLN72_14120, partial [Mycobacterium tuberculosis]
NVLRSVIKFGCFNLQASQHFHCFAFIVKRFRVFRAPAVVQTAAAPNNFGRSSGGVEPGSDHGDRRRVRPV